MDTECDLTFQAGGDPRLAATMRNVRNQLLGEHLGASPRQVHAATMRSGALNGAIRSLQSEHRSLRRLEVEAWSEGAISVAALADPEKPVALDRMIDGFAPNVNVESGRALRAFASMIAIVAGLTLLWKFTPLSDRVNAESAIAMAHAFASRPWAPLAVMLAYTPACLVLFPRPLITLFAIIAFGSVTGLAYALGGILIAALATYWIGRSLDRAKVRRFAGPKLNRVSELLRTRGLLAVTILRLVPVAPFAVGSMVAGAIRVKVWHYLLGTVLGMLPGTLALTVFGTQIEESVRGTGGINYWVLGGAALALAAICAGALKWADAFFARRDERRRTAGAQG
jgi:uncharacterized membrane protein YdjX (TVP38/TMEM64 family)